MSFYLSSGAGLTAFLTPDNSINGSVGSFSFRSNNGGDATWRARSLQWPRRNRIPSEKKPSEIGGASESRAPRRLNCSPWSSLLPSLFFVLFFSHALSDDFGLTFLSYPAFCSVEQTADGRSKLSDLMAGKKVGLGCPPPRSYWRPFGIAMRIVWIVTSTFYPTILS